MALVDASETQLATSRTAGEKLLEAFVAELAERHVGGDRVEARHTKTATHLEKLIPSILAKAFRGENSFLKTQTTNPLLFC